MFGLLNLDKPAGMTSRDVVNRVQKLVKPVKVGHAGTLDPLATGVLVICLGQATRLVPYIHEFSKTYVAEFLLGVTSETDDTEGELRRVPDAPLLTAGAVETALPRFCGRILQTPPTHSAVKVQGRRAYALARRGADLQLEPREVEVHRLVLREFTPERLTLEVECSSGTYIRSLGRDLGLVLGSGAVMCGLRRTRIGPFGTETALSPDSLTRDTLQAALLPSLQAVAHLPSVMANPDEVALLRRGLSLQRSPPSAASGEADIETTICDEHGQLLAIGVQRPDGQVAPRMVLIRVDGAT